MKYPRTILAVLLAFALLANPAHADTVTLKDGTKIEGTVTDETDTEVKISVQIGTITDVKIIKRDDIADISKLTKEDLEFAKIEKLVPTGSLVSATEYETMIRSQVERFIRTYPASSHKEKAEAILATLNEELAKASKGAIKIDGTWITQEEQKKDKANVDARILHYRMRQKVAADDYVGALRDFDKLNTDYLGTHSLAEAIEDAKKILPAYAAIIATQQRDLDARMEKRKNDLLLLPEHKRAENEAYFEKEMDGYKMAAERDKKLGHRWTAANPRYKAGLDAAAKLVAAEIKKLNAIDTAPIKAAADALAKTQALIEKRKLSQAKASLAEARKLVKGGLYLANVQENLGKLETTLAEEAEAAKKSDSEKALESMKAYKGENAESASSVNQLADVMKRKREAAAKAEKEKSSGKPAAKPKTKPSTPTAAANPPPRSTGGRGISFQTIIFILAGILVVVTGGLIVVQKKRGG